MEKASEKPVKMLPYSPFRGKSFLMMLNAKILLFTAIFWAFVLSTLAQSPVSMTGSSKSATPAPFFPLSQLKEGMKGTARTVFHGSEPEDFSVEILGVVPGAIGPKQDLIVGRISGGRADRTSVFAGMSGSPVYIDGKLVGAISYSFPFSKEPICGITPIEQMIAIFEKKEGTKMTASEPNAISFAELASTNWSANFPKTQAMASGLLAGVSNNSLLASVAGQSFQPIATPMTFTGFSQQTLNLFAPQLMEAGLIPVAAVCTRRMDDT